MNKRYLSQPFVILSLVLIPIISCKKEEVEPTPSETPTPTPTPEVSKFTWKENNGSDMVADSSFWTTGTWGTGIRAYKGGYTKFFEINWDTENNISSGAKTLDFANYGFTFLDGSSVYTINTNQTLTITGSANNKLSGNFTVTVTGGTLTTIQGSFTALDKK